MSRSDGSSADYYVLPEGATQLQDLISHRDMNSQIGEIFRACYRYGIVSHSDKMRDAKKIRFYAQAEVERLEKLSAANNTGGSIPANATYIVGEAASEQCGQLETETKEDPCPYDWQDAPNDYNWLATDREGAFWYRDEPEMDAGSTRWLYPFRDNIKVIDEYEHDLAKYQRPQ